MILQKMDAISKVEKQKLINFFEKEWREKIMKNQQWCLKKIFLHLNNPKFDIKDHAVQTIASDYQTDLEFVKFDFERC